MTFFCPETRWMIRSFLEKRAWSRNVYKSNICFLWSTHFKKKPFMNIPACETIHWNITSRRTHKGCICCPHDFILLSKNTEMFEVISHRPTDESVWFFYFTSKGTCKSAGNSPWDKRVMSHICLYLHVCCTKGRATQDTQVVVSEVSTLCEVAIAVWRTALERKLCLFSVLFIYHLLKWLLLDSQ